MDFCEVCPVWEPNRLLVSPLYKDSYFSKAGAIAESCHIFLQQNRLPHRWLEKPVFHICETGFGTGLNFLLTMDFWRRFAPSGAFLHYTSIEKHPIPKGHLAEIHKAWPSLHGLSRLLLDHYPACSPGKKHLLFPEQRMGMDLILADAAELDGWMEEEVDAWFLDGFSPGVNPQMWSRNLFQTMGKWTARGGTFATFTAAGFVRRALSEQGFSVEKIPGFRFKKDMLRGVLKRKIP
nr:tRNA (5-methylaminomethyl-2-thiouridine)(34)-methyltransferase MnmD [Desulfobotulus pelophilus]